MSIYNKITAGFTIGAGEPVTAGIEDVIYIFNEADVTLTYSSTNPLIVTGLTAVSTAKVYKFEGTNNSFNTMSKLAKTQVGPRYTEEIDFNIAGLSVDIKAQLQAMGYGRIRAIMIGIVVSVMGTYFQLKSDITDMRIKQEAQVRISEIRLNVIEGQIAVLQQEVAALKIQKN